MNPVLLATQDAVSQLYSYSLQIAGLAVFVMFLIAGLTYIIPGLKARFGEPTKIMRDAVLGLILLFSAYLILSTINPDLVGDGAATGQQIFPPSQPGPITQILPPIVENPDGADTLYSRGVYVQDGVLNNDDPRPLTIIIDGTPEGIVEPGGTFTMSRLPPGEVTYTH